MLQNAALILRNVLLEFKKKKSESFNGSIDINSLDLPVELQMFVKWVLSGTQPLDEGIDKEINCTPNMISQMVVFNLKTEKQVWCMNKKRLVQTRRRQQTPLQIALALSLRH